nr:MAG TPA: exonuclease [Caudoviricetes sp.]
MRISEVIRTLGKDQLVVWANILGFKKIRYKDELDRTANIGTMVHGILEDLADETTVTELDRFGEFGIYSYSDRLEAMNAVNSFLLWQKKNEDLYKVVATEVVMVGEEVGGTTDVILQSPWHKDRVIIGDYKTAKAVYLSMYLQAAGYIKLYEELNGAKTCDGAVIFQLDKHYGTRAKPKFIKRKAMQKYIDAFEALLVVAKSVKKLEHDLNDDEELFTIKNLF